MTEYKNGEILRRLNNPTCTGQDLFGGPPRLITNAWIVKENKTYSALLKTNKEDEWIRCTGRTMVASIRKYLDGVKGPLPSYMEVRQIGEYSGVLILKACFRKNTPRGGLDNYLSPVSHATLSF